jgi:Holliday junction resolvase RusA-like endonuclease
MEDLTIDEESRIGLLGLGKSCLAGFNISGICPLNQNFYCRDCRFNNYLNSYKTYNLNINPVPKPRMVNSDKWKNRPSVNHYWAFKNELVLEKKRIGMPCLKDRFEVIFFIEMPRSWSRKKRDKMNGKPHQQKPDLDNLTKAIKDCLLKEDSQIYSEKAEKLWSEKGLIKIIM